MTNQKLISKTSKTSKTKNDINNINNINKRVLTKNEFNKLFKVKKKVHPIIAISNKMIKNKTINPSKFHGLKKYG